MKHIIKQIKLLHSRQQFLPIIIIGIIGVMLPAVVFVALQRQENRSSAYGASPTPRPSCAPAGGSCNSPGSQGSCCSGLSCSALSPYTCFNPRTSPRPSPSPRATPRPSCTSANGSCSTPGSQGYCCSGLTCSTSTPYTCTSSGSSPSPRSSPRITPRPSPSPTSNPNCSYPGQTCSYRSVNGCRVGGQPGSQTCTFSICGTGNVCSLSPKSCTPCVAFPAVLNNCRESCIAAGNRASDCLFYQSCGEINLSCSGKPNNTRCQLPLGFGYCQSGTCQSDKPVNSSCTNGNHCDFGLACISGKCRQVNLGTNASCVAGVQCQSRLCLDGQCRAINLNNGQTCAYDVQCNSGTCTQAATGAKTCQQAPYVGRFPAPAGHFCGTTSFATYYCTGSYQCKQGLCKKSGQLGASCTLGADCASGRCLGRQCTGINPDEVGLVPGFNLSSSPLTESQYYAMMMEKIQDCKDACTSNSCRNQCETNVYNEVLYYSTLDSEQAVNECIMLERFYGDTRSISQLQTDCNTAVDSGGIAISAGAIGAYATFNNPGAWNSAGEAGRHAAKEITAKAAEGAATLKIQVERAGQAITWYLARNQNIPERINKALEIEDLYSCIKTSADQLGDNVNGVNWQTISLSCRSVAQQGSQNGAIKDIVKLIVR